MAFRFKDKERPASYVCRCASALHVCCCLQMSGIQLLCSSVCFRVTAALTWSAKRETLWNIC